LISDYRVELVFRIAKAVKNWDGNRNFPGALTETWQAIRQGWPGENKM
jgi:hypothetical protein